MITPARQDLELYQGATFERRWRWVAGADKQPVDLTYAAIRMQARRNVRAGATLLDATTDNGLLIIDDAPEGRFRLHLPAALTDTFAWQTAVYDLEVDFGNGQAVYRLLEGQLLNSLQVTR